MKLTRLTGTFLLMITAMIWGGAFIAQSTGMKTIGPITFIAGRFALALITIAPFALRDYLKLTQKERKICHKWWLRISFFSFSGMMLQQYGLLYTSVTNAGFLTALYVPFVPLILLFILRKPPHFIVWPAVILSICGTYLLNGATLSSFNIGDILIIACAFFWAGLIITMAYAMQEMPKALLINVGDFAILFTLSTILAFMVEDVSFEGLKAVWPQLAFAGIISSAIAFVLQSVAQKVVPPAQATIIMSLEGVFAAIAAYFFLHELLTPIAYIGCALILFAILMVEIVPEIFKRPLHNG